MSSLVVNRSFGTHDGTFHADEVTACALLVLFNLIDKDKIQRTRDVEILNRCEYVCDVGRVFDPDLKRFDHHQISFEGDISSAGMVLRFLRSENIVSEDVFNLLNNSLIKGVDAHDLGIELSSPGVCTFSHIVSSYNNVRDSNVSYVQNECFMQAVDFALSFIKRIISRHQYVFEFSSVVKNQMEKNELFLVFDEYTPWSENFFLMGGELHPALFVIMPSKQHWKAQCIPISLLKKMTSRILFPQSWAGLFDDELEKVSGIKGAIFCHKGRFMSIWKTKNSAIDAVNFVVQKG